MKIESVRLTKSNEYRAEQSLVIIDVFSPRQARSTSDIYDTVFVAGWCVVSCVIGQNNNMTHLFRHT